MAKKAALVMLVVPSKSTALRRCRATWAKLRSRAGAAGNGRRSAEAALSSRVRGLIVARRIESISGHRTWFALN